MHVTELTLVHTVGDTEVDFVTKMTRDLLTGNSVQRMLAAPIATKFVHFV